MELQDCWGSECKDQPENSIIEWFEKPSMFRVGFGSSAVDIPCVGVGDYGDTLLPRETERERDRAVYTYIYICTYIYIYICMHLCTYTDGRLQVIRDRV